MKSMGPGEAVCPHLASLRDVTTFYAYPSAFNGCARADPPAPLPGSYQASCCLTPQHVGCRLNAASWSGEFPSELRNAAEREWGPPHGPARQWWPVWVPLSILSVAALVVIVLNLTRGAFGASAVPSVRAPATPAYLALANRLSRTPTASATPSPTPSPTVSPTPTPSHTPTPTFTMTPGPQLETPFGGQSRFLIHAIRPGDTLSSLAVTHGTSVQAIQVANRLEYQPLWIGQMLVIPVGTSDPAGLPAFEIVQVAETGELLSDLAARFAADLESIRAANALGANPWLPPGRWLIIPLP